MGSENLKNLMLEIKEYSEKNIEVDKNEVLDLIKNRLVKSLELNNH
ncbi:hypothetical protein JSY36_07955 [Bacillus sp. H-16]|nr:hypothetical protein [Alteribacter salitolerans]MBM7095685.1 hypothetical protein [Alteribacter salitolerans]